MDSRVSNICSKMRLAEKLRGGAIIEASDATQAKIAEEAGACAIMVSCPPTSRTWPTFSPSLIKEIKQSVSVPVMAKVRIGHFVEAQILEAIGVDFIEESEQLNGWYEQSYINKHKFNVPFSCRCQNLGDVMARMSEGAVMIRIWGSAKWNVLHTMKNIKSITREIKNLTHMDDDEILSFSRKIMAPCDLLSYVKEIGRLPVLSFGSGGILTPADAAFVMRSGCDGVFLGSNVFRSLNPHSWIESIVQAVRYYNDPHVLVAASSGWNDATAGSYFLEENVHESDTEESSMSDSSFFP